MMGDPKLWTVAAKQNSVGFWLGAVTLAVHDLPGSENVVMTS